MKKHKPTAIVFGVLAIAWIGVLFYFSGQTGAESTSLSMGLSRFLVKHFPWIGLSAEAFNPILRKLAHFGIFAVEGFFTGMSLMSLLPMIRGAGAAALVCALMAAANEYHQTFTQGRAGQLRDVLIDSAGAAAGILAAMVLLSLAARIRGGKTRKKPNTSIYRTGDQHD